MQADWYRNGFFGKADATTATESGKTVTLAGSSDEGVWKVYPRTFEAFEDDTASIRIFGKGPKNTGDDVDIVPPYSKFFLESVQESHQERSQVVETFGDFYVFMFGQRPPVYSFKGTLVNSKNANWLADFMYYYENFMRGTKCVEQNARTLITYGGRQIEGFMLGMTSSTEASIEGGVAITFQILVTSRKVLGLSDDFSYFKDPQGNTTQDEKVKQLVDNIAGQSGTGLSADGTSNAFNAAKKTVSGGSGASASNLA